MKQKRRHDEEDVSESSDSGSSSESSDSHQRRKKKKESKKKKRKKESRKRRHKRKSAYEDDGDDADRRRKDRHHRHRREDRKKHSDSEDSDDDSCRRRSKKEKRNHSSKDNYDRRRRHKKSKKDKRNKDNSRGSSDSSDPTGQGNKEISRSHQVAQALVSLFHDVPTFVSELPLILIRIAGGATFDLSQMTDMTASRGLQRVFESLSSFGIEQNSDTGLWMFQLPPGARRDEFVLLRIVRALLDEIGITMDAIEDYETKDENKQMQQFDAKASLNQPGDSNKALGEQDMNDGELHKLKNETRNILAKYNKDDSQLGAELRGLCKEIAEGQSISLDGLADENLRVALESLFVQVGLEKSEIEEESDDDDEEDDNDENHDDNNSKSHLMGYGLPEAGNEEVQLKLAAVMQACREPLASLPVKRLGPMRKEEAESGNQNNDDGDDEDDEGPLPVGAAGRRARGPALPPEMVKAQAKAREQELKVLAEGGSLPPEEGKREEWMLVPGKYDFLGAIKSGQTKSRTFKNKKSKAEEGSEVSKPVHPAIQAELDEIMEAHANSRGPSLIDQHRAKNEREKAAAAGTKKEWKWSRDDLDAGRRVDKDALNMVLGGAADSLKTKFHGGFNR